MWYLYGNLLSIKFLLNRIDFLWIKFASLYCWSMKFYICLLFTNCCTLFCRETLWTIASKHVLQCNSKEKFMVSYIFWRSFSSKASNFWHLPEIWRLQWDNLYLKPNASVPKIGICRLLETHFLSFREGSSSESPHKEALDQGWLAFMGERKKGKTAHDEVIFRLRLIWVLVMAGFSIWVFNMGFGYGYGFILTQTQYVLIKRVNPVMPNRSD
jgi:hypothetical protein